jgi:hypothetical protein
MEHSVARETVKNQSTLCQTSSDRYIFYICGVFLAYSATPLGYRGLTFGCTLYITI